MAKVKKLLKFAVTNRYSGAVQFTAKIDCAEDAATSIKMGLAVKWAIKSRANLSRANLSRANLSGANLSGANLSGADLSGANLSGADLRSADLRGAVVKDADLRSADLSGANLFAAALRGADLSGAVLNDADLRSADLSGANLTNAYLFASVLHDTNLKDTILIGVHLSHTVFANVDISCAKDLDAVRNFGPSPIGIDTLYASNGKIPESFLRDAGVPEDVIELARSLRCGPPIQWHSCFISYSTKDEDFARRLHSRMREANMRAWFAPEDLQGGKKLHEQLFEAIQYHDRLLLVLSQASIQSEWVMTEIRKAREVERRERRRKLFPVRLVDFNALRDWTCFDADSGKDLAVELREYFIPDFSAWKSHDSFEKAFSRLQADLKAIT